MTTLGFDRARWSQDGEGFWLSLRVERRPALGFVERMRSDRPYEAELRERRQKRSLDANAYAWVLIGKLSATLRLPKEQVYREAIREIGDNFEVVPMREGALERWTANWTSRGTGWMVETLGPSKFPGYVNTIIYYGSSVYDSRQMSLLIDCLIEECREQGIETLPPEKVALLKEGWK